MSVKRAVLTAVFASVVVGGTAAAAEMFSSRVESVSDEVPTTLAPDTTTTTTVEPGDDTGDGSGDESGEPADEDGESGDPARSYEGCGDFTEGTHGDYVSQAAHAEGATGQTVSEAARSNCGKPLSSIHSEPAEDPAPEAPAPEPSASSSSSSGHGSSSSHGGGGGSSSHGPPPQAHGGPKH